MKPGSALVPVLTLALSLTACNGESPDPDPEVCDETTCGEHATCDDATGECVCDDGFDDVDGDCLDTREVPCDPSGAPANATAVSAQVTIDFDGEAWSEPAACDWTCDSGFDEIDGACLDERQVPCDPGETPANATAASEQVSITFDGEGWSDPAACDWTCDSGFDEVDGACLDERQVPCDDSGVPANATAASEQVTVTYDGAAWSEPAACDWSCDDGFFDHDDTCFDEDLAQLVDCTDAPPEHGTSVPSQVLVTRASTSDPFPDAPACDWTCDDGYHPGDDACVADVDVLDCVLVEPELSGTLDDTYTFTGRALVDGDPAAASAALCYDRFLDDDPTPDALTCLVATPDDAYVPEGDDLPLQFQASHDFAVGGTFEYVFAVTGDGGGSWAVCDTLGVADGSDLAPGLLTIDDIVVLDDLNGGFEDWPEADALPAGWLAHEDLAVTRSTAARTGDVAARLTRGDRGNIHNELRSGLVPVTPGASYTIAMWVHDDDPTGQARHVYEWFDASAEPLEGGTAWGDYTSNDTEWQELTETATAPSNAAYVRVRTRVYGSAGATVLLDDVSVSEN